MLIYWDSLQKKFIKSSKFRTMMEPDFKIKIDVSPVVITLSSQDIIEAFKNRYVKDFGSMDDKAYFIVGILLQVFGDLYNQNAGIKNENQKAS